MFWSCYDSLLEFTYLLKVRYNARTLEYFENTCTSLIFYARPQYYLVLFSSERPQGMRTLLLCVPTRLQIRLYPNFAVKIYHEFSHSTHDWFDKSHSHHKNAFHNENAEFHIEKWQIQLQVDPSRRGGGGEGGGGG